MFINFGAVDQIATVFINGAEVATHKGGYTPFKFEITDYIKDGENEIRVVCLDFSDTNEFSRGKQKIKRGGIWYTCQSGIWQSVWLESTPKKFLEKVKITPDYDNSTVSFEYFGTNDVEVSIFDGDRLIAKTKDTCVSIPDFKSWSPESPFLYNVEFSACGETIKSYFGMRKFSVGTDKVGGKRLFLNNKPYFHNGLLDQGYYPDGLLTPPSNEAMKFDIEYVKSAGFNMLRKHIKVEPLLWYHYCDVNGIIVWQDMINGGGKYGLEISVIPFVNITLNDNNYSTFHRTDKEGRVLYYQELEEIVDSLYNCPCIALWVLFNEGWGQFDALDMANELKKLDPTRFIDHASGWQDQGYEEMKSRHIYFRPVKLKNDGRALALTEYGGYILAVDGHRWTDKVFGYRICRDSAALTHDYEKLMLRQVLPHIRKEGLTAAVYTQITDVEEELNGLMTYDREVLKIPEETLREINKQLKF